MPDVTILVADDRRAGIDGVAAALQKAGLRLGRVLPETGVITGAVDDHAAIAALSGVDGVEAVEPAQEVFIPPPDAPIQ